MPRSSRRRTIPAPVAEVWELISDPYALPRWWPRTSRVESVDRKADGKRTQWTKVLETAAGRGVRADYRCVSAATGERYLWEQQLGGTPFDKHLRSSTVEIRLRPQGEGTEVSIVSEQKLRGISRLGGPMMRGGQNKLLDQALDGLEAALGGDA